MLIKLQEITTFSLKFIFLTYILSCNNITFANSTHNLYGLTFSIISYSQFENQTSTHLCVLDQAQVYQKFVDYAKAAQYRYSISLVSSEQWAQTACDIVFFADHSPQQQQQLLNSAAKSHILSFSQSNTECEIGSSFCLYRKKDQTSTFKVNLDSLARAKIRVDPRVLLLARASE